MKLRIKATQSYTAEHIDTIVEEYECNVEESDEKLIIQYEKGVIEIEEQRIFIKKEEQIMQIELDRRTQFIQNTEYGDIVMQIRGIEIANDLKQKVAKVKYEIGMLGVLPYINEIEISVFENE